MVNRLRLFSSKIIFTLHSKAVVKIYYLGFLCGVVCEPFPSVIICFAPRSGAGASIKNIELSFSFYRLTEPTLQRLQRKKIQTNICQVFILYSAWGFIIRPPKGGTSAPSSSFFVRENSRKER